MDNGYPGQIGGGNGLQSPMMGSMSGTDDIANKLQLGNQLMGKLVGIISNLFPRTISVFTMAAASSKTITDANVTTSSLITLTPTNAAAATLMGSAKALYVTAAAGSFTVTTANAASAAGSETYTYAVQNLI